MVFVTVGNATQGFRRLLNAVDWLAGENFFKGEEVFVQAGNNPDFASLHCKQVDFLPMTQFAQIIHKADVVIGHAGAGTLFHIFQAGKVPVVMPRQAKYTEHVDNHQVELVRILAAAGRLVPAYEPDDLPNAIDQEKRRVQLNVSPPSSRMLHLVSDAIDEIAKHQRLRPKATSNT